MNEKKISYRVPNWKKYNESLVNRGSLTLWLDEELIAKWHKPETSEEKGRPLVFHSDALLFCLIIKAVLHLPYRQTEGFVKSLFELMNVSCKTPDYSWMCKKASSLNLGSEILKASEIAIDSSGFKISGEGEWKVRSHGKSERRKWVKLHIAVDTKTHMITAQIITSSDTHDNQAFEGLLTSGVTAIFADGAYDSNQCHDSASKIGAKAIIPPRENSILGPEPDKDGEEKPRDELILWQDLLGEDWSKMLGYTKRVHAEGAFSRLKRIFGDKLQAKKLIKQANELITKIGILNRFTRIGMPNAVPVN